MDVLRCGMRSRTFDSVIRSDWWRPFCCRITGMSFSLCRQVMTITVNVYVSSKLNLRTFFLNSGGKAAEVTSSQDRRGERGVWQPRFWEHTIFDEEDLHRCVDYVHWNPRKHGLVARVADWPWSTFRHFVAAGHYDVDWGGTDPDFERKVRDWGE